MTTANGTTKRKPAWQVEVTAWERKIIEEFVEVTRPDDESVVIRFRVNRREGRVVSFTDYREEATGTAGTTGIWGTLPPERPARRRTLTPTAFRYELIERVGEERAKEVIESLNR
jgi:hypothetical protein